MKNENNLSKVHLNPKISFLREECVRRVKSNKYKNNGRSEILFTIKRK